MLPAGPAHSYRRQQQGGVIDIVLLLAMKNYAKHFQQFKTLQKYINNIITLEIFLY